MHIHRDVQPSLQSNFRTFSSLWKEGPKSSSSPSPLYPTSSCPRDTLTDFLSLQTRFFWMLERVVFGGCLLSPSIMVWRFIHVVVGVSVLGYFLQLNNIPLCGYVTICYPSISWWTFRLFALWLFTNNSAVHGHVPVFFFFSRGRLFLFLLGRHFGNAFLG